jgi:hypothetical protein
MIKFNSFNEKFSVIKERFMKAWCLLTFSAALILILASISGCKYDVAEPPWDNPFILPPQNPSINSIEPASAAPGVNTIKIIGANLDLIPNNWVYFGIEGSIQLNAEIVERSSTSIICRRPNLVTDSCMIKIVPKGGLVVKYGPFIIDPVYEEYGTFLENNELGAITVDNSGNVYVIERLPPFPIIKISSAGEQTVLVDTLPGSTIPTEAIIGPEGYLYIIRTNRIIQRVNAVTGEVANWHRYASNSGNQLKYGDFDENGYLYTGGRGTDLVIISPDSTSRTSGMYQTGGTGADIQAIIIHNNNIYLSAVLASVNTIWKHSLDGNGNVGAKELVYDVSADSRFLGHIVTGIIFSEDGKMYLATDSSNPLLISENGNVDFYYKNILPPYCKKFTGFNNYLYLMIGNTTPAQNWMVYRVDIGTNLAP